MDREPAYDAVLQTNDDATISRLSAVQLGYFNDPFVHLFVKRPTRRMPIINRGTYLRSRALDQLMDTFLAMPLCNKQIVSLGAGFDTRYFMHKDDTSIAHYFEVDLPENTMKKARTIKLRRELGSLFGDVTIAAGGTELSSGNYHLVGGDLRAWPAVVERLVHYGFDPAAPTLFVSECVFIYITPAESSAILDWITQNMSDAAFMLYEQILPDDSFGRMMIRNLQARHIDLKGIHAFPQLKDQEQRFLARGWTAAKATDMNYIHDTWMDAADRQRIGRLEFLDELEEWKLIASHYCVAWAYKSAKPEFQTLQSVI
ncbi:S-adenosyl-L-methionine-dependent methyltransferase [Gongronella butleri]|nr:S-adenosyl-L-methionine-dependent methyltransferase [Gongronella butleri]